MTPLFTTFTNLVRDAGRSFWDALGHGIPADDLLPLLKPVARYAAPRVLSPLTTLATLLGLTILSGIALGALGLLLLALVGLYLLLNEVLGITVEIRPFAA
ncbi:MAG: hypothetical protein QOD06_3256 [Candidatus Binatota bacterium]|jgi:hypothetical protein|nr:hypothetical protein [Candidatus Binatota bacterium]